MPQRPGKARKSTVISVRLDPKQRFALNLLARKRRRSMTSVIEWALQHAIEDPEDGLGEILDQVWDTDEADRFVKVAQQQPAFLSFEEEKLWKAIREDASLWKGRLPNFQAIRAVLSEKKREFEVDEL